MDRTGLAEADFHEILEVCSRFPIDESTPAEHIKSFLVAHLSKRSPGAAGHLHEFDRQQMEQLAREILAALRAGKRSALLARS